MKDITTELMQQFRREHKAARRYMALLLALALLTSLFVNWQLHSVGIAQTADYQCGEIEHQHTAECYEKVLVCGYEEGEPEDWNATKPDDSTFPDADYGVEQSEADIAAYSAEPEPEYIFVPHQHTDDCYQEVKTLTCYEEEHVHTDDCFDPEDGSLICDLFEHTHDDSCYSIEYELVCGLEEGELVEEPNPDYVPVDEEAFAVFDDAVALQPVVDDSSLDTPVHHHTDACYEEVLVCGLPEHHHTVNCLSDPLADVEDEETWSAKTNVVLTGAWADDLTAVAKSQLGYQQSERNFQLDDEDQTTVRHYTRYGAWYGNAYGAWDVMFLSYCLNHANIPQSAIPQESGTMALHSQLRGTEYMGDFSGGMPIDAVMPGDIVFYNSITTETVAVEEDAPQIMDDSADADIALLSLEPAAAEPQTEERTVSTETVGIVSDVDENPIEDATVRIVGRDGLNEKVLAKKDGKYRVELERDIRYVMMASARGYLNQNFELKTGPEEKNETYIVDFFLSPISKPVVIENIFYDFDKATLRPESKKALDEMIKMLNDNPNVTIELGAHTDRKGSEQYNERLAQRRAQSVVDYLIAGGIAQDRLEAKGYGESVPKAINKRMAKNYDFLNEGDVLTEEFIERMTPEQQEIADQINRRTEFKVLRTNYNLF